MPTIALLGTLDTKLAEFLRLRELVLAAGGADTTILLIDVGRSATRHETIDISQPEVLRYGSSQHDAENPDTEPNSNPNTDTSTLPRGALITHMTFCTTRLLRDLDTRGLIHAALSAGGSGGSALAAGAMRSAPPVGFPKLIVSTVASGDVGPLVDGCDVALMHTVVDIAGRNAVLEAVFGNAAGAVVGMARAFEERLRESERPRQEKEREEEGEQGLGEDDRKKTKKKHKVRVGVTMFGVTTPCVDALRARLESRHGYEVYVFHATGSGGRAMERMLAAGGLDAVADITTTEVADYIVGGVMSAGSARLETAAQSGVPCVVSVGAVDMVNFGPKDTVPPQHSERTLFVHNPTVTLMRTTPAENTQIGDFIARKLREFSAAPANVKVMLPLGAVSMLSAPGQPFEDREADEALFRAVRQGLEGSEVQVLEDEREINDEGFAARVSECLAALVESQTER